MLLVQDLKSCSLATDAYCDKR